MLHETLIYLLHNRILKNGTMELKNVTPNTSRHFLHPGEKQLMDTILEIDYDYHWIMNFYHHVHFPGSCKPIPDVPKGLYVKAYTKGADEVLEEYRKDLVKLEEEFLTKGNISVTYALSIVGHYLPLLNIIKSTLELLYKRKLNNCSLMDKLAKYIYFGSDMVSKASTEILKSINTVFYHQLSTWIFRGIVIDDYNEFFIVDGKCDDTDFLYPKQNKNDTIALELETKPSIQLPPPVRKFYIKWDRLPTFIKANLAETILFMGRAVWVIKNGPPRSHLDITPRDIWEGKESQYCEKMQELENEIFDVEHFGQTLDICRSKLTKFLWKIMVDEGKLLEHLNLIRDFFIIDRSTLFQEIIKLTESHVKYHGTEQFAYNLNVIFMEAAEKFIDYHETYKRFEFLYLGPDISEQSTTTLPKFKVLWANVRLNFEIKWPLHIVFHPRAMELYNRLFLYLLRLKRTQINLQNLFRNTRTMRNMDRRVWALRQQLTFLLYNIQYYLQVDVIASEYSIMLESIHNASEFEDVVEVHQHFLTNVLSRSFLLTKEEPLGERRDSNGTHHEPVGVNYEVSNKIYNVIMKLADHCDSFCLVAITWKEKLSDTEVKILKTLKSQTDTIVKALLLLLHNLQKKADGHQNLLQLLRQIDFNNYFTRTKSHYLTDTRTIPDLL